jgi:hypothetical protein
MGPDAGLFNVGEPMASRVGSTGMSAADITSQDMPLAYGLLDAVPGVATTTAWNIGRVSNTITGGGTAGRYSRFKGRGSNPYIPDSNYDYSPGRGRGGMFGVRGGGITQTVGPRHMRRLTRAANIDPSFYGAKSGIYTPFNSLASIGNRLFSKTEGRLKGNAALKVQEMVGSAPRTQGEAMFSSGTLGRISSMGRISAMGDRAFDKSALNIRSAIADINPTYYKENFLPGIKGLMNAETGGDDALRYAYRSGVGSTINSRIAGRAAGYIQGAEAAYKGKAALHGALSTATGHFRDGLHMGAKAVVGPNPTKLGKFVGKGYATGILRGASTAGWIMLAHDIALGVGRLAGAGIKTAFGAAQSTLGSINKGVMGMGFKDNAVAATSRQRGVMAIQNSRLNARSALGSEAAMLNAHFG